MRRLPLFIALIAFIASFSACREERHSYVPNASDPERVPTMATTDVATVISDSGYTRYRITTPLWQMFDQAATPHWSFPQGLELQQFDHAMRPDANITCDSATYLTAQRIWRLDGHVVMVNTARDSFLTNQIFWDQTRREIYSDSFIHIVRADRIIEGFGFLSNEQMTAYTLHHPTGIIPIERPGTHAPSQTASAADSSSAPDYSTRRPAPTRASQRNPIDEMMEHPVILAPPVQTVKHF